MSTNEILQIVVFSIFFGLAASIGDHVKPVINALDKSSHIILKMVNYVMNFAPRRVWRDGRCIRR
jgi:Na+/H+-dicarboxylate symporter